MLSIQHVLCYVPLRTRRRMSVFLSMRVGRQTQQRSLHGWLQHDLYCYASLIAALDRMVCLKRLTFLKHIRRMHTYAIRTAERLRLRLLSLLVSPALHPSSVPGLTVSELRRSTRSECYAFHVRVLRVW